MSLAPTFINADPNNLFHALNSLGPDLTLVQLETILATGSRPSSSLIPYLCKTYDAWRCFFYKGGQSLLEKALYQRTLAGYRAIAWNSVWTVNEISVWLDEEAVNLMEWRSLQKSWFPDLKRPQEVLPAYWDNLPDFGPRPLAPDLPVGGRTYPNPRNPMMDEYYQDKRDRER